MNTFDRWSCPCYLLLSFCNKVNTALNQLFLETCVLPCACQDVAKHSTPACGKYANKLKPHNKNYAPFTTERWKGQIRKRLRDQLRLSDRLSLNGSFCLKGNLLSTSQQYLVGKHSNNAIALLPRATTLSACHRPTESRHKMKLLMLPHMKTHDTREDTQCLKMQHYIPAATKAAVSLFSVNRKFAVYDSRPDSQTQKHVLISKKGIW